ncbi:MAG: hydantoinase/oxoprolinase family protein [Chloroflexi bacterium]|nr:hydantoinase/oxoprolinase family protein [Chloroflexota bacterium]MCY3937842.1 hydantoinase/oxoprolinase family protein [Chloroflexota bacterium]
MDSDFAGIRVGVDTGGTFTDLVAMDVRTGHVQVHKRPSTPAQPSDAIFECIEQMDAPASRISYLVVGTTVAINSIHQRNGARVIYVTTRGFEDIPFLQRTNRRFHYDLQWSSPTPLVLRRDSVGVPERIDYQGEVLIPLSDDGLDQLAADIRRRLDGAARGDVALAINFLFSYVSPDHELMTRDYLRRKFPDVPVSVSYEVAPIWREYDRASTTLVDAYVRPLVHQFVQSMQAGLEERGFDRHWSLMKSNGGQMLSQSAADRPVQTLLSGLSGGIIAGRHFGEAVGQSNVITLDMGGTSTDVGVVVDGLVRYTTEWEIEFGLPVSAPFIDMTTIGAGGGSIAFINKGGLLQVGPSSAGAVPGPACYGQGGDRPTVTDANIALGRLNPDNFLGGEVKLHPDLAVQAVGSLSGSLGTSVEATAAAIVDVANENIAEAIRQMTIGRGLDPREFAIVAFGGAGPLHAAAIARSIGVEQVIVPPHPGLTSAFGTLLADLRVDKTWTNIVRSDRLDPKAIDDRLQGLVLDATEDLRREGYGGVPTLRRSVTMRYLGQNYEEEIPIPAGPITAESARDLLESFHQHYEQIYGYRIADEIIEMVQFNVTVIGRTDNPRFPEIEAGPDAAPVGTRSVLFDGQYVADCPIYDRDDLAPDQKIEGPAIIEELDSTTFLRPGDSLTVTRDGTAIVQIDATAD